MSNEAVFPDVWVLDDLYPACPSDEFRRDLAKFEDQLKQIVERSDRLPPVGAEPSAVRSWAEFLVDFGTASGRAQELSSIVGCHASADAGNQALRQIEARLSTLDPLLTRANTNVEFALAAASAEEFENFVEADPRLSELRFYLEERRTNCDLRLPKGEEQLAAELGVDGLQAWGRLYDRVSGDLRITVMEKGEVVQKSPGQVHFDSPDRSYRENRFYAAEKAWRSITDTCADTLNHIAGTRLTLCRRLGLKDHLVVPLRRNRMHRRTLETMWRTISERKQPLVDYLNRKAQLIGVDRLAWYDLQAPMPQPGPQHKLGYQEACQTILATFNDFSGEFCEFARAALANGWIEAENRAGKRQGGFCTAFPLQKQSRIFMTYTDSEDSMSTLAHELGHAYHSHVLRDQPVFLQDYPMNLAESASTLAEAVLGEMRLAAATGASEVELLDRMLGDAVTFLMNIHARFVFENQFHIERQSGELSPERLSEVMVEAQQEAYCDALGVWNPTFWASKLHFHMSGMPFYNFPYTFGYLLSLGLFAVSKDDPAAFPQRYRAFLAATGSMSAEDSVKSTFDHDLTQADFWNLAIDIIHSRVERFLKLTG